MDIFNKHWRKYIHTDDDVLLCSEQERRFSVLQTLWAWILFGGILALVSASTISELASDGYHVGTTVYIVYAILLMLGLEAIYLHFRSKKYVLSDMGIYVISGWLFKHVKFVAYNRITDINMKRSLLDLLCTTGSVNIDTASGNKIDGTSVPELSIKGLEEYTEIYKIILDKVKK